SHEPIAGLRAGDLPSMAGKVQQTRRGGGRYAYATWTWREDSSGRACRNRVLVDSRNHAAGLSQFVQHIGNVCRVRRQESGIDQPLIASAIDVARGISLAALCCDLAK